MGGGITIARIIEILVYIMGKIRENKIGISKLSSLTGDLIKAGYAESEIDLAFTWLFEKIGHDDTKFAALSSPLHCAPHRLLHATEKMVIRPAAYGYLLQLRTFNLIDSVQMEQAIEQAMLLGESSIDKEDIEEIVATLMFDIYTFREGYTFVHKQIVH